MADSSADVAPLAGNSVSDISADSRAHLPHTQSPSANSLDSPTSPLPAQSLGSLLQIDPSIAAIAKDFESRPQDFFVLAMRHIFDKTAIVVNAVLHPSRYHPKKTFPSLFTDNTTSCQCEGRREYRKHFPCISEYWFLQMDACC